jgi:hypothetical protein
MKPQGLNVPAVLMWLALWRSEYPDYVPQNDRMTDEVEKIWKGTILSYPEYNSGICMKGRRKSTKDHKVVAGVPAWKRSKNLNRGEEFYH